MIDLCIDARMAFSSGIGTYIRHIVPLLHSPPFRLVLLVDQTGRKWCQDMEQMLFQAPIYSMREQLLFPFMIPRCDLFWSPHYNAPLLPIRAKKRIATIHDVCHLAFPCHFSKLQRAYARTVMGSALRRSDAVISVSSFTKTELHRHFGRQKTEIAVFPSGVDRVHFQRVADPVRLDAVRRRYQISGKFLLYVGNVKRHKNVSTLVRAFLRIEDPRMRDWKLVIAGRHRDPDGDSLIAASHRVLYLEDAADEDLSALYSLAELFVFPSLYEGFGLPPLEAMSCGCPVVVSRAASLPEVCGNAALYFDPASEEDLSRAIVQAAFDLSHRAVYVERGGERAGCFDWERSAERHRMLFRRVCYA